jgi:hypothetical protein
MSPGTYDVTMFYTSSVTATVKLAIGTYASILTGTANSLTTTLPAQVSGCSANLAPYVRYLALQQAKHSLN